MKQGLIQIYTGDGKGKTTAAVGQVIRAIGHGLKVGYIYFHKQPEKYDYGEIKLLKKLGVDIFGFAKEHPFCEKHITKEELRRKCLEGLKFIKEIFNQKKYDLLVIDELNISIRDGFITEEEVLELLNKKPKNMEVIITGRGATKKLIEKADLVSEIKKIKHHYDKGIKRRKGIEY